jgi:predicted histidine transporter YuiF (NhaC family)
MTIITVNLVLNTIVAVLLVGYGLWFKNVVQHQLSAKDSTIETLKTTIVLHETEIAAVKGDRAPAIASAYKVMREHANLITEENQKLDEQVRFLTERQREEETTGVLIEKSLESLEQVRGLHFAINILLKHLEDDMKNVTTTIDIRVFMGKTLDAMSEISKLASKLIEKADTREGD